MNTEEKALFYHEMALNDLYEHLLQTPLPKGTKMIEYAKKFIEKKDYNDGFWFEVNINPEYKELFFKGYKDLIQKVKDYHSNI